MSITNLDFLECVFAQLPDGAAAMVTGFSGDPGAFTTSEAQRRAWFAKPWAHGMPLDPRVRTDANNYLAIGSYFSDDTGTYRRRKALFARLHGVMIDDIGTKVPHGLIHLPLSALVETSPKNYQGWYLVNPSRASDDQATAARLIEALVDAGLTADGSDPGMKGTTRYGRLPVGVNSKAKYVQQLGVSFRLRVVEWNPTRAYTVEEIAQAYQLDISPLPAIVKPLPAGAVAERIDSFKQLMKLLAAAGMYLQTFADWHHVICPWVHTHTDRAQTGTAISDPSAANNWAGGFRCHHGHCTSRGIGDVYRWARAYTCGRVA